MLHLAIAALCSLRAEIPEADHEPPPVEASAPAVEAVEAVEDSPAVVLPTVVLVVDRGDEGARLEAAIGAHLHGDVNLVVTRHDVRGLDAPALERLSRAEAARVGAVAVFWVRPEDEMHALYLAQPTSPELWVRRVEIDVEAPSAGLEALGVIVRATTNAVLDQAPVGMEVIPVSEPEPPAPAVDEPALEPAPTPPPPPRGRMRLGAGYAGTTYAPGVPWLSGAEIAAAWVWPFGLHAGIDTSIYPRARVEVPEGRVEVTRHPWAGRVGYDRRWQNLWYGADFGVVFDYPVRRASADAVGLDAQADRGRLATGLAAGLRLGVVAVWRLELFVAARGELWLSRTRYGVTSVDGTTRVVLDPRRIRANVAAGLAMRI